MKHIAIAATMLALATLAMAGTLSNAHTWKGGNRESSAEKGTW